MRVHSFLTAALLLAASVICSCSKGDAAQGKAPGKDAVPVRAALVNVQNVPVEISTFGNVATFSSVGIKAQVQGTLTKVHFERGDMLHKGQLLFTIDSRPYDAVLAQSKATKVKDQAVTQKDEAVKQKDEAAKQKDEVLLAQYRRNLKHEIEIHGTGAATQDEVDQAQTIVNAQVGTVASDQAIIASDQATIASDQAAVAADQSAIDRADRRGQLHHHLPRRRQGRRPAGHRGKPHQGQRRDDGYDQPDHAGGDVLQRHAGRDEHRLETHGRQALARAGGAA